MPVLSNPPVDAVADTTSATSERITTTEHAPSDRTAADDRPSGRKRWLWVVAVLAVVAVGAGVAIVVSSNDGGTTTDAEPITLRAVTAETTDLIEFTDLSGTLRYASVNTVGAGTDGVVTSLVSDGATVGFGDELYALNGLPAVVFYGDVPLYRDLAEGAVGDDVLTLEQNLSMLGYHVAEIDDDGNPVDEEFVVDGVFDSATAEAVVRWQEDIGIEPTGVVAPSSVVVLGGPSEVIATSVDLGDQVPAGTPLVELNQVAAVTPGVFAQSAGEIELLVSDGQELASGDVVYAVDGLPVTALVTGVDFDRELSDGVDDGPDVAALEEMLLALGYDADGALAVDEVFDEATELALVDWQADLENTFEEVDVDGTLELEEIVVVDPGTRVGTVEVTDGAVVASGAELWTTTVDTTERVVDTAIGVADQELLAEGTIVDVEFPDGEVVAGTVRSLATSSTTDPADPSADATLAVEIVLPAVPESVAALNELDVVVKLVDEVAEGVTAVPVSALVAVGDGRYAVEVVTSTGTEFVAVTPGMFSDGVVEVDGIAAGTQVVVPS
ncbi:MAG: peptidoglycan-binding domain-containing protein [Actinomycetota bacterium]